MFRCLYFKNYLWNQFHSCIEYLYRCNSSEKVSFIHIRITVNIKIEKICLEIEQLAKLNGTYCENHTVLSDKCGSFLPVSMKYSCLCMYFSNRTIKQRQFHQFNPNQYNRGPNWPQRYIFYDNFIGLLFLFCIFR